MPIRLSGSSGLSGLFGFSSGFAGQANKTDQIDQISQIDQTDSSRRARLALFPTDQLRPHSSRFTFHVSRFTPLPLVALFSPILIHRRTLENIRATS
jgi:hypothetical protein